jgi:hypothetical protein
MGRFDDIRERVAELIDSRESEPEPKGYAGDDQPTGTIVGNYLENNPPKEELQEYWQLYRDVGLIKGAINNFASEVLEPGWYITCDNEETAEELTEFMENVAIVNFNRDANISQLMEKMLIEREVRGTVFIEKVTDDEGRQQALYPLQNDTITIYTKPGKAMLPAPDDPVAGSVDVTIGGEARTPTNDGGETGAYVQFDDLKPRWNATEEVVYTRDEIIHWNRDADIGEIRGNSRIRSIQDRAEGWLQKVQDNDAAIRSKAWPMIIFNMGTEDNPWSREQVENFLEHYDDENMEPGLMQAVSGDVSVEEFAGETADIEHALNHDINAIMSGMPGPVYATGGFSQNVAPAVAQAQERQFIKEVKETRRSLENKMTPYLREVAEDYELDSADSVEFHVGRPAGEIAPEDVSGSIIRYTSDVDQDGSPNAGAQGNVTNEGGQGAAAPQPGQANRANDTQNAGQSNASNDTNQASFAGDIPSLESDRTAELADPRLVSTPQYESSLSSMMNDVLTSAREYMVEELEATYSDTPVAAAGNIDSVATRSVEQALQDTSIESDSQSVMEDIVSDTVSTLNQDNHDPPLNLTFGARHRQRARSHAERFDAEVRSQLEDMVSDISSEVQRAAQRGEPTDRITERIENTFDDNVLDERSDLVAHMETQNAVNTTKLVAYEQHGAIDGIQVINACGPNTTPLCEHLAGCGAHDRSVAWFDSEQSVSEQLESGAPDATLFDGFDPLPPAPPFHFGCTSEIVPASRDNE